MRRIHGQLSLYRSASFALVVAGAAIGCSSDPAQGGLGEEAVGQTSSALTEDALAQAYGIFKDAFTQNVEDKHHHVSFGFHPGLSTERVLGPNGAPVFGQATIHFVTDPGIGTAGTVTATLTGPSNAAFDLYFLKNSTTQGSVKPESFDTFRKVGSFAAAGPNQYTLTANIGSAAFPNFGVNFDLDEVIVTRGGQTPTASVVAEGARTLFEKRFFREKAGRTLDPVTGTLSNTTETTDPLVKRGAQLFFNEKFNGNGRTCGTCHRLEDNLTIDPAFVATLPANDSLFVFPAGLEDATLLPHALIRENVDGFDNLAQKFVERSVPHTLAMSTSIGEVITQQRGFNDPPVPSSILHADGPPPDQRTGWGGDGAPGRGTLIEFAFGAVVQHFPTSTSRVPGTNFRIPTQAELEALEAFQLFSGRQKNPNTGALTFADSAVNAGRDAALGSAQCVTCHRDLIGSPTINFDINTGVETLAISFRTPTNMPKDGGFGVTNFDPTTNQPVPGTVATGFGDGQFNIPPLFEAADTGPFFHNGAIDTIEGAVNFYSSLEFLNSPGARVFAVPDQAQFPAQQPNIVAFMRTINALTNIVQIRRRVTYLRDNATQGGTTIMNIAIKDSQDAINDLTSPTMTSSATQNAINAMKTVKLSLQNSLPFANNQPTTPMIQVLAWLDIAKNDLITANPLGDF